MSRELKKIQRAYRGDRAFMSKRGISRRDFQDFIISRIPCGMKSVQQAMADQTNIYVNAARAITVIAWKGMVSGFSDAEMLLNEE